MRKHLLSILFVLVAGAIWWASISSTLRNPVTDNGKPVVVVSGYVPYTLTKELAGDSVNVLMLLPPGAEPHSFEPTPGTLVSMKYADAFIYLSDELEPWAKDLAASAGENTRITQLAQVISPQKDPHIWMNPKRTGELAQTITDVLTHINPAQQKNYQENLHQFNTQLNELDQQFKKVLATCQSRDVVHVGHLAFKNLADAYGLTLTALSGTSHQGEHSAQKLAVLTQEIKNKNVHAIFTEETLSPRLAQAVAQETGAQVLPLYPIEHISKKDFNANVTYVALMRRNLVNLMRGLQCQAF